MTGRPEGTSRHRPMTVGEVAQAAGVPRETLRTWLRNPVFDPPDGRPVGKWRRYSDFETITICVYGRLVASIGDHNAAEMGMLTVSRLLMDEWVEDADGVPYFADSTFHRDRFLFLWRADGNLWDAAIAESDEELWQQLDDRVNATYREEVAFTTVNLGMMLKQVLLRVMLVEREKLAKGADE